MTGAIECHGLVKIYQVDDLEVTALQGLDLTIDRGEVVGIIGPSGSGKSTLMKVLGGVDTPSAGRAVVAGHDLGRLDRSARLRFRRQTVGFIWQEASDNLVPYLSAVENVELPMVIDGPPRRDRARQLLALVGLEHRMTASPERMSGGEQQRVATAVALANAPPVLLADEPTGSLDSESAAAVLEVFETARSALGVTVVVVTHDLSLARLLDRYVGIRDGKTSTEAVRRNPAGGAAGATGDPGDLGDPSAGSGEPSHPGPGGPQQRVTEPIHLSHDEYVLLDSAGRLQLPPELRERLGIRRRVTLRELEGRIEIVPDVDTRGDAGRGK